MSEQQLPAWADPSVSPATLDPQGVTRRGLLRRAGLFGAAFALGSAATTQTPALAAGDRRPGGEDPRLAYLVGDHHVHSVYSHDAKYTFSQLAAAAAKYGLDWMVFTEHSNFGHADHGAALEHKEILKARAENPRQLIFQGLEWYIPAAEHCTVFTTPGLHEVDLLTRFERAYDGKLLGYDKGGPADADTARNEAHAVKALKWLSEQRRSGYVDDILVLANHPLRLGIDSPHEMRAWRDAAPEIMIGMEGAPGAQGAAIPGWRGATSIRGEYENKPSAQSWPGYPADAYLTYGGFDWATATVGGLWDSMLAEEVAVLDHHQLRRPPDRLRHLEERRLAGRADLRQHRQAARPGEHGHPAAGQRLLARPVQPHPRGRDPLRLPRGHGGPARGPRLAGPRASARRARRTADAGGRPGPGRDTRRPHCASARARSSRCTSPSRPPRVPTRRGSCPSWRTWTSSAARCAARSATATPGRPRTPGSSARRTSPAARAPTPCASR